jgi:hypothetical protein
MTTKRPYPARSTMTTPLGAVPGAWPPSEGMSVLLRRLRGRLASSDRRAGPGASRRRPGSMRAGSAAPQGPR